jgi:hypothetical protein
MRLTQIMSSTSTSQGCCPPYQATSVSSEDDNTFSLTLRLVLLHFVTLLKILRNPFGVYRRAQ